MKTNHSFFCNLAFNLAEYHLGKTKTNPSVGCVVVKNDCVISSGITSISGRPHAEYNALNKRQNFKDSQICEGISELDCVVNGIIANGVDEKYFKVDARIARGLDYYTGTVYETNLIDHMEIGSMLRGKGIKTDVYLNKSTNLPKQLDYANKKKYKYVIIANKYEFEENSVAIRNMNEATQETVLISDIVDYLKDKISN